MNPKILTKPYFYSAKMAPKKVDNLLTFKGANPLTLWRPKCGQPSASPAYIYIYRHILVIECRKSGNLVERNSTGNFGNPITANSSVLGGGGGGSRSFGNSTE